MRVTDMVLAFPMLVLAMAVAAALGASLAHGIIALTAVWWPQYVRVCRGIVLELRDKEFVEAARAAGRRTVRHPVPGDPAQCPAGPAGDGGGRYRTGDPEFRHSEFSRSGRAPADTRNGARWCRTALT